MLPVLATAVLVGCQSPAGQEVPDFVLIDLNPASSRASEDVSPRDYLGQVSVWNHLESPASGPSGGLPSDLPSTVWKSFSGFCRDSGQRCLTCLQPAARECKTGMLDRLLF